MNRSWYSLLLHWYTKVHVRHASNCEKRTCELFVTTVLIWVFTQWSWFRLQLPVSIPWWCNYTHMHLELKTEWHMKTLNQVSLLTDWKDQQWLEIKVNLVIWNCRLAVLGKNKKRRIASFRSTKTSLRSKWKHSALKKKVSLLKWWLSWRCFCVNPKILYHNCSKTTSG